MSTSGNWALLSLLLFLFSATVWAEPVDVNSASAVQLAESLVGVGEARARAIVEYREQNGPFATFEDLMNVAGVGPQIIDANRTDIRFGASGVAGKKGT